MVVGRLTIYWDDGEGSDGQLMAVRTIVSGRMKMRSQRVPESGSSKNIAKIPPTPWDRWYFLTSRAIKWGQRGRNVD